MTVHSYCGTLMSLGIRDYWFYLTSGVHPSEYPELKLVSEQTRQRIVNEFRMVQQRKSRWALFVSSSAIVCIITLRCAAHVSPLKWFDDWIYLLGYFVYSFALVLTLRLWGTKSLAVFIRRELRRQGFLVCMHCGYDLRGQTVLRCPECGAPFEMECTRHDNDSNR